MSVFGLKLLDIEQESLEIPEQEYGAVVTMKSEEFQRICKCMSVFGDTVQILVTKESTTFKTLGDIGNGEIICPVNEDDVMQQDTKHSSSSVIIDLTKPVSLSFALSYLIKFSKATSLCDTVRLSLSKELPMALEYRVGMGDENSPSFIKYFLAPKIEDE